MMTGGVLETAGVVTFALSGAAMACALWRLVRSAGPADRVNALDVMGYAVVTAAAAFALWSGEMVFVDVAVTMALIAFLSTVVMARYLLRRAWREGRHEDHPPTGRPDNREVSR